MTRSRLAIALSAENALPPSGRIAVLAPPAGTDLSMLPKDRLVVVQGFRPDHDAFAAAGFAVTPALEGDHAAGIVFLPRARERARAWLAEMLDHVRPGGPVWIDGQKTDGIDTMLKDLRARLPVGEVIAKAHGKIFAIHAPAPAPGQTSGAGAANPLADNPLADWRATPTEVAPGFVTLPGVFSADAPDPGSQALAAVLPEGLSGRVADLGAGWGWLSAEVLKRPGVTHLDLIEADHTALDCARRNVTDPRAHLLWADATRHLPETRYDAVVCNPPFHSGRAADPALGAAFIRAAAAMLAPAGQLWLVANRHLPYLPVLEAAFRDLTDLGGSGSYRLIRASHPRRSPARTPSARPVVTRHRRRPGS